MINNDDIKLKDILIKLEKSSIKAGDGKSQGKYPLYTCSSVLSKYYDDYLYDEEALIIGTGGSPAINYCNGKFCASTDCWTFISNDKYEIKYIYYLLLSKMNELQEMFRGAGLKHLNREAFMNIQVKTLEINDQRIIIEILDRIQEIIDIRKHQIENLDVLIKARFVELFGDLKTNPFGWECKNLLEVADIDTVMVNDYEKYADYPHIGIDSIEKNTGKLFGYRTIAEDGVISGKYLFTDKHIIYSKIRPNLNKVAMPDFEGLCSADAYPILPKEDICLRIYLGYVMRSEFFLDYILPFSRRANMPKVNKEQLSGFNLPVPPIELQNQFATFVEQTDKSKLELQKILEEMQNLFDSLMAEYFG